MLSWWKSLRRKDISKRLKLETVGKIFDKDNTLRKDCVYLPWPIYHCCVCIFADQHFSEYGKCRELIRYSNPRQPCHYYFYINFWKAALEWLFLWKGSVTWFISIVLLLLRSIYLLQSILWLLEVRPRRVYLLYGFFETISLQTIF